MSRISVTIVKYWNRMHFFSTYETHPVIVILRDVLIYIILYYIILYCIVLYYIILYYTILYYIRICLQFCTQMVQWWHNWYVTVRHVFTRVPSRRSGDKHDHSFAHRVLGEERGSGSHKLVPSSWFMKPTKYRYIYIYCKA